MASRPRTTRKCCTHKVEDVVYANGPRKKYDSALTTIIKRAMSGDSFADVAIVACKCSVIPLSRLNLHLFTCNACRGSLGVLS